MFLTRVSHRHPSPLPNFSRSPQQDRRKGSCSEVSPLFTQTVKLFVAPTSHQCSTTSASEGLPVAPRGRVTPYPLAPEAARSLDGWEQPRDPAHVRQEGFGPKPRSKRSSVQELPPHATDSGVFRTHSSAALDVGPQAQLDQPPPPPTPLELQTAGCSLGARAGLCDYAQRFFWPLQAP